MFGAVVILLILAAICFFVDAFPAVFPKKSPRVSFTPLGLFLLTLSMLWPVLVK